MKRLRLNFKSYMHKFLEKSYLMNIFTLTRRELHQSQLLIQNKQIGDKNAAAKKLVLKSEDTVLIKDSDD